MTSQQLPPHSRRPYVAVVSHLDVPFIVVPVETVLQLNEERLMTTSRHKDLCNTHKDLTLNCKLPPNQEITEKTHSMNMFKHPLTVCGTSHCMSYHIQPGRNCKQQATEVMKLMRFTNRLCATGSVSWGREGTRIAEHSLCATQ